jgi:hypothetical protein
MFMSQDVRQSDKAGQASIQAIFASLGSKSVRPFLKDCAVKKIKLTQGKYALVDNEDFEWLNQWKWCAHKNHNRWYVERGGWKKKEKKTIAILMHREILKLKPNDTREGDHKNGNGLDNQRHNLRICTHADNQHNQIVKKHSSKFKGVYLKGIYLKNRTKKWGAQIRLNHNTIHLGYFYKEVKAAKVYDKVATELFGEFACLNFPKRKVS